MDELEMCGQGTHRRHVGRAALPLFCILLLAAGLRLHRLAAQSLWYDEAVTAHMASQSLPELTRWTAADIQPPLYYYLVAGWVRLLHVQGPYAAPDVPVGRGEWLLRFPSAFWGVLTTALAWVLARRLFGNGPEGQVAALLAALLTALSPLYVYYSQEARMYTQLTALACTAGYALLQAVHTADGRKARHWWAGFVLAATAMLYTHYFGAFVLLAYGVWLAVRWACAVPALLGARTERLLRGQVGMALLAAVAILLLYSPWLPAMLTRYRIDRSYWQGSLKLGEALRHVAVSFTAGAPETMLESRAVRLLPWFGLAFVVTLTALVGRPFMSRRMPARPAHSTQAGVQRPTKVGSALVFLSAWLLIPILLILLLASRTPKFNARYLMMCTPAYLLLMAGGGGTLLGLALGYRSSAKGWLAGLLALSLVGFQVGVSLTAIHDWFTDPAFTKAQWRELTQFVRRAIGPDEVTVLVSGHAWPVWDYYAPDLPRVLLPDIDVLDVEAVLGYEAGARLAEALRDKSGVWVVFWQAEVVDPVGFVPYLLDRAGQEQPVTRQFWHLRLRHWRLPPDAAFPTGPQPMHTDAANYGHQIALLGWDDPQGGQVTVYWQALSQMERDYRVSLVVEDPHGTEVSRWDGRPAGYDYPTPRWRAGQVVFGRYPLPADIPPGEYYLTLALYDDLDPAGLDIMDVADNPAGKRVRLGPVLLP
jgi:4-amino-4-deoxy-L-arabinose transferase-like glycosyltransferase